MPYLTQIQRLADNEHRPTGSGKSPRLNQFGLSQGYLGKNVVKELDFIRAACAV